jgi:alpha-mannosidase
VVGYDTPCNIEALLITVWVDAAREFPDKSWEAHEALQAANTIIEVFTAGNGNLESISEARKVAQKYLGDRIDSSEVYNSDTDPLVYGIGHCHIDTCWLWPWDETKRKVARSWSNQCDLMDRYPEHRFTASSAQQFKWLKELYPTVHARLKEKVKTGSFQPIGGSWVEHDTNMPSGESLIRQFLYGQRFFEAEFGKRSKTFWLPDTFGYTSQLPQLCRLAEMSRFVTQKLSWNNINDFPHTTFNWVALDGSQVLCHMPPSETYNAQAEFSELTNSIQRHKSLDQDATSLLIFGKGDGGGGPTFGHIENLRRFRGLSDKVGLLPRVHLGKSVDDFFVNLEKKAMNGTKFVTWYGELYFELHRGTYTTQAKTKLNNRKAEIMIHDIEYLATLASVKQHSYRYPKKEIDDIWESILLCQFHDCLPGSSIGMCYDDSDKLYAEVFATGSNLLTDALSALGFLDLESNGSNQANQGLVAINTLPWPRTEFVKLPSSDYALVKGDFGVVNVEKLSTPEKASVDAREIRKGIFELSNDQYKLEIENGAITSLIDLTANRQVIAKGGKANQMVIFDDKPLYRQAWDVEVFHITSRQELPGGATQIAEQSLHKASVVTKTKISDKSWVKSTISLTAGTEVQGSGIEIDTEVEWHEDMKFLKVEFDVNVSNTVASYETQFGIAKRPTHYNTTWDMAKFEVCCHKWADLSENGYGVSILNDSKYGFATCGSLMRLSLLRSPKAPDARADMGKSNINSSLTFGYVS